MIGLQTLIRLPVCIANANGTHGGSGSFRTQNSITLAHARDTQSTLVSVMTILLAKTARSRALKSIQPSRTHDARNASLYAIHASKLPV